MPANSRHASVSSDTKESSDSESSTTSSSSLGSDTESSVNKELYYSYEDTNSNSDSNSNSEDESPPPPSSSANPSSAKSSQSTGPPPKKEHRIAARAQAVTLFQLNYPMHQIERLTTISRPHIYCLHAKALERSWNPDVCMKLEDSHLANAERTSRPPISIEAAAAIVKVVTKNSITRGYSCKRIAQEVKSLGHFVAPRTVYKILKAEGYSCCKLTVKPGLNKEIKKAQYEFAKKYRH